jgi:hypothetical protein
MTAPASQHLRQVLALTTQSLSGVASAFWSHPRLRALYPRYLVCVHTVIRASVPLMAAARDAATSAPEPDPLSRSLAAYLDQHIPEELDHDDWLLDDLARIGIARADALDHVPSPAAAAMVGAQYYYIRHFHPVALLGYIGLLEGYPPTEELARAAAQRTGYPIEAFRTLRKHANLDPAHRGDLDRCLDAMPLTPADIRLITTNAMATTERLVMLLNEIVTEHPATLLDSERALR